MHSEADLTGVLTASEDGASDEAAGGNRLGTKQME